MTPFPTIDSAAWLRRGAARAARATRAALAALALLAASSAPAYAQGSPGAAPRFPAKAVTLVVPYPPGGSNDVFARALGKKLSEAWGQPVVVDNRGGAGGAIGAAFVSKSAADGYTLMLVSSSFTTGAAIQTNWPFDPVRGFTPIAMVARGPMVLTVANTVPARTVTELVALAKAKPGTITFGSAGTGSVNQFATELLLGATGTRMAHVPYKGMGQATVDVIAGHVDVVMASAPSIMQHVRAGKVRAIAVTSPGPSELVPGVPPISASVPGYAFYLWWCVMAPAGLDRELAASLNADINRALAGPDMKEFLAREGTEPYPQSPTETGDVIRSEIDMWKRVAAGAGIKAE